MNGLRLDDVVVILTGASSGLGRQLARGLSAAGAKLALVARRAERLADLERELGTEVVAIAADITATETPGRVVAATTERFGKIDGLVNNAGVTNVTPALKETIVEFRNVIETNLIAPFALSRAVVRSMRETGGGSIVNVASVVGIGALQPLPEASYAASKAGLIGMTRELATQWARYGIRVNAIAPGAFTSEMTADVFEEQGALGQWVRGRVPMGREGRAGELDAITQVLLHRGSSYVTGQVIAVDGGLRAC